MQIARHLVTPNTCTGGGGIVREEREETRVGVRAQNDRRFYRFGRARASEELRACGVGDALKFMSLGRRTRSLLAPRALTIIHKE